MEKNRWHGATYSELEMSKTFFNERIKIKSNGTIPLIYNCISGNIIPRSGFELKVSEIYSNIVSIGAEYDLASTKPCNLLGHIARIERNNHSGHVLKVKVLSKHYMANPPDPKSIPAFVNIKLKFDKATGQYLSQPRFGDFDLVVAQYKSEINRYLISESLERMDIGELWVGYTPVGRSAFNLNEDMNIMLAFFHLSNIVRYNPQHLYKLLDSKYWPLMLGLRKHGFLRFIKLMWGNYIGKSFDLS